MRITSLILCLPLFMAAPPASAEAKAERPAHVPDAYRLVYEQTFDKKATLGDFVFTDPKAWRHGSDAEGNGYLELHGKSQYKPKHRSPYNIALIRLGTVGSFVLDVDLKQTSREYGHRDMCVFFGFNDPEHYYYTHMATKGDQNAHQVFIVNDAPRTPVTKTRTKGVDWGKDVWIHVRVVRDAGKGTVEVYFDDMDKPVQTASDKAFQSGYLGFGSFDDVGRVDNIRLWAKSMAEAPCKHLKPKD